MAPPPPEAQLYLGQTLANRYLVQEYLNRGQFCLLFRALDLQDEVDVALKILGPQAATQADAVIEFDTEGELLKRLRSCSNVVDILDSVTTTITIKAPPPHNTLVPLPVRFLVLELAPASLAELLSFRHALSHIDRLRLFRQVALGTHQMHHAEVAHRDIKSDNTLVFTRPKKGYAAKVADLGRARDTKQPSRFPALAYVAGRGDLRFAPPEALWHQLSEDPISMRRSDLYLLGSILFDIFTGQGITAIALGNGATIASIVAAFPPDRRGAEYRSQVTDIRSRYATVFDLFAGEVPRVIRREATALLAQLCDPDPARREFRCRAELAFPSWDCQWVLRRTDILIKRLSHAEADEKANRRRQTA